MTAPSFPEGTTKTRLEKNSRSWWRSPHVTTDQHLGFPSIWVWLCDFTSSFLLPHEQVIWCFSMDVTLLSPRLTSQKQVARPSPIQASNETISDSEEKKMLTFVCLHIRLMGNECSTFQHTYTFHLKLIFIQGHQQNRSPEIEQICKVEMQNSRDNVVGSNLCDEIYWSHIRAKRLPHMLFSIFVTARASSSHRRKRMSSLPIRAMYNHC